MLFKFLFCMCLSLIHVHSLTGLKDDMFNYPIQASRLLQVRYADGELERLGIYLP